MISKKRLKLKQYQKPPPVAHDITIVVEKGWAWWNCSCGEWSDTQWNRADDVGFWAQLHERATR